MSEPGDLQRGTSAEAIARHLRTAIEAGEYRHLEQLPSTRTLAKEWRTSVATITRAMQALVSEGLVESRDRSSRIVNYPGATVKPVSQQAQPTVVIIGGYAGSGKTELGRILARLTGWPILDKDSATRPVVEMALEHLGYSPHDRESEFYISTVRPSEYEALRTVADENVRCGNSVIMTAPFLRELGDPSWARRIEADAQTMRANLRTIWVRCDTDSMRVYLSRRGAARDAFKLANWDDYLDKVDQDFTPALPHTVIDNSLSSTPLQEQAVSLLSIWR